MVTQKGVSAHGAALKAKAEGVQAIRARSPCARLRAPGLRALSNKEPLNSSQRHEAPANQIWQTPQEP